MTCSYCRYLNLDDDRRCRRCGRPQNDMYATATAGALAAAGTSRGPAGICLSARAAAPRDGAGCGATPGELSMMTQENKQFIPNFWWPPFPNDLPYKFESQNDYDYWMLKNGADYIDNISEHTYAYP